MNKFLERFNELRNGTPIEELALKIGISSSAMFSWYSRENMPKLDNIIKISNFYKCSIDYLLGRSEDNSELAPKDCPDFHTQLANVLNSKNLKTTHLRNKGVISSGLNDSIFNKHSIPFIDNVIKIADFMGLSVDELVGRV